MKTGSLGIRLFGLAGVTIAVALGLAWMALTILFQRHVEARVNAELANQVVFIASNLNSNAGSVCSKRSPQTRV